MRRALDTVNPVASGSDLDVELLNQTPPPLGQTFWLETQDGVKVGAVSQRAGTAGLFFPNAPSLRRLVISDAAAGAYVLKTKQQYFTPSGQVAEREASMSLTTQSFQLNFATLMAGGSGARRFAAEYSGNGIAGKLYVYATGGASDICAIKSAASLKAMPNALVVDVPGEAGSRIGIQRDGASFADADTACLQFVADVDGVAQAPYTYHLRYMRVAAGSDAIFDVAPAGAQKQSLSLSSMPAGAEVQYLERRQLFALGDVAQQATSNSNRITLEQLGAYWRYRVMAPTASDHAVYVAKSEGRPPIAFYLRIE